MADETFNRDGNHVPVVGFVTDNAAEETRMGQIDDDTKGMLVTLVGGVGGGTVTSIAQGTGILLTPNPITTTGTVALSTALQPMATLTGNSLKFLRVNAGETALEYATVSAGLTVGTTTITSGTNTRVLYNNSGVLGEYTVSGSGNVAMTTSPVFTTPNIGSATGSVSGNAGTATALQNARTIGGVSFDGTANITVATATGGFTVSGGNLALGTNSLTLTGSVASTGSRVTKGWFTDVESTNMYTVGGTSLSSTFSPIAGSASIVTVGTVTSGVWNGTDIALADGGTGATLADPGADRIMFWDDSAGTVDWLIPGTGLTITDKTITASGGSSALTLIPYPATPFDAVATTLQNATNTTAFLGQIIVPFSITVNKISFRTGGTVATAGTLDLTLYSEDGQTQLFSVTTASISATNTVITTAVSSVALSPGIYYIMVNPNGTADIEALFYTQSAIPFTTTEGLQFDVASEPVLSGTLTITAGTPPATFTPSSITQAANRTLVIRLDN